jgi:enoyl-CoA hydratase
MSATFEHWTIEADEGVVVARFANPPMGFFCARAAAELAELIDAWKDDVVRAVVLTGTGGKFITHYSVDELIAFGQDPAEMERIGTALSDGYHALLASLAALPKPVIAAISGDCMGGGLELAMWCDIRIAERGDHRLGLPEIRLGIMPGGSGTQRLVSLLGEAKAREMILLGRIVDPTAALALGLVSAVADDALSEACALARDLAGLNPRALANIKMAMHIHETGLKREALGFLDTMRSAEALSTMQHYTSLAPADRRKFLEFGQSGSPAGGMIS